ncbi:MAG: amino acid permease [Chloroflexia bacterium]|nr:amino acid permease [Chloroflexia bacterium]
MSGTSSLARRLTTTDAVLVGLGSMIGAGVFAAFGPAAEAAGSGLLIGLAIAASIAFANATASAQLAAAYPLSGGTYVYGRERLGEWWGFAAGWAFVIGKTSSCAAMAMTVAAYAVSGPGWLQRLIAVAAVVALAALNLRGVTRTAQLTRILVSITLTCLALAAIGILFFGETDGGNLDGWYRAGEVGIYGVLQAAGLLFFAFAGYARIATMGEEVIDPERAIPRAISLALLISIAVYAVIGVTVLLAAGPDQLAASAAPLVTAIESAGVGEIAPVVRIGGIVASMGALLALIAGIGRTGLAMARNRDLPTWLAAVHPTYRVPHHAEIALAAVVCGLVLVADLRGAIGFSSFGVLIYYAIANASAYTQDGAQRRTPRALNVFGLIGCLVLVAALPWESIMTGLAMFAIGLAGRLVVIRRRA